VGAAHQGTKKEMTVAVVIARAYEHMVRRRAAVIELTGQGEVLESATVLDPQGYVLVLLGRSDPGWDEMLDAWRAGTAAMPGVAGPAVLRLQVDGSWTLRPAEERSGLEPVPAAALELQTHL
jgi:hypothetical protein